MISLKYTPVRCEKVNYIGVDKKFSFVKSSLPLENILQFKFNIIIRRSGIATMVEFNILGKDVHLHHRFVTSLLIGPCHNLFFGERKNLKSLYRKTFQLLRLTFIIKNLAATVIRHFFSVVFLFCLSFVLDVGNF